MVMGDVERKRRKIMSELTKGTPSQGNLHTHIHTHTHIPAKRPITLQLEPTRAESLDILTYARATVKNVGMGGFLTHTFVHTHPQNSTLPLSLSLPLSLKFFLSSLSIHSNLPRFNNHPCFTTTTSGSKDAIFVVQYLRPTVEKMQRFCILFLCLNYPP